MSIRAPPQYKRFVDNKLFAAPVNLRMVPPNLRAFVTPSIRRLYIEDKEDGNDMPIASSSSDISRLEAENHALRNNGVIWQRRAEILASANLNLIKLVNTARDQASHLALQRDELQSYCSWLKSKLDDDELGRFSLKLHNINCSLSER